MIKLPVKQSSLDIILMCFTFYEPAFLPHYLFIAIKYLVIIYLFFRYFTELKYMKTFLAAILLYGGITVLSTFLNHMPFNTLVASFVYMFQILDIYLVTRSYLKNNDLIDLIKLAAIFFICCILIMDFWMLFGKYDFTSSKTEYLFGNKFIVSYMHCFTAALLFGLAKERYFPFCFLLFSILMCVKVTCMTGIIICVGLGVLMLMPKKVQSILTDGKIVIISVIILYSLFLGGSRLFLSEFMQDFVLKVFGRSGTWVGRLRIYSILFDLVGKSPWIGYGYFNSAVSDMVGFGNAQNGIMKVIVDSGIIGLIGYAGLAVLSLMGKKKKEEFHWPLFVFIYAMIIAGLVEINLTHMFVYFVMAIISTFDETTALQGIQKKISTIAKGIHR